MCWADGERKWWIPIKQMDLAWVAPTVLYCHVPLCWVLLRPRDMKTWASMLKWEWKWWSSALLPFGDLISRWVLGAVIFYSKWKHTISDWLRWRDMIQKSISMYHTAFILREMMDKKINIVHWGWFFSECTRIITPMWKGWMMLLHLLTQIYKFPLVKLNKIKRNRHVSILWHGSTTVGWTMIIVWFQSIWQLP